MMRCLTYAECADWCRTHNYPVIDADFYGRPTPGVRKHFTKIDLVSFDDVGERVGRARQIMEWMNGGAEVLLWLDDWAVWPRMQHMPLFTRFREAFGEHRPLIDAPGQLITPEQLDDGISVLTMALWFLWDCYVFSDRRGPVYVCSHDEWNSFFVPPDYDRRLLLVDFASIVAGAAPGEILH
jgi:hypothetical protein